MRVQSAVPRRVAVALIIETESKTEHAYLVRAVKDTGEVETVAEGKESTLSAAVLVGIRKYRDAFKKGAVS